ncbi:MAG: ABC transporter permease [Acidobacteriota bacterium]
MTKFLAVVKREYLQRVRTKMFVVMTVLGPVLLFVFTIVPGLLVGMKAEATRLAIVDQTADTRLYSPLRDSLASRDREDENNRSAIADSMNSNRQERVEKAARSMTGNFLIERVNPDGLSTTDIKRELNSRIGRNELDGYLVLPPDILENADSKAFYYGRNVGDVITSGQIKDRLNRVIRKQRLIQTGIKEQLIEDLGRPVSLSTYPVNQKGEEGVEDSGAGFATVFIIAFLIYLTVLLYGQVVLGAVVEEKETRIAEILFSSVQSFTLMVGKLVGVSLLALTQLAIWAFAFALVMIYGINALAANGISRPPLPPWFFVYFFLFFTLGYFIYATIYVLVGAMVTTTQEGGQVAMPIVFLLMAGLYLAFPVIRSPNSRFAFWASMFPFFSPITMIVRILAQTPPFWQIALSFIIGVLTVILLLWLASRIYRIGMLMYGKRASIPEVWKWLKQA